MRRVRGKRNSGDVIGGPPANFNRRKTRMKLGDHLVQCDVTGQVCFRSEARKTWRGLLVSKQNWDVKHPQLTINVPPENIAVADARPFKSSEQSVGSDILNTGAQLAILTNRTITNTGTTNKFKITSTGLIVENDVTTATGEWWSLAPTPTPTIGDFYQVRITVNNITGDIDSINGPVGSFVSLASDVEITINYQTASMVVFYIELKNITTQTTEATAFYTMDNKSPAFNIPNPLGIWDFELDNQPNVSGIVADSSGNGNKLDLLGVFASTRYIFQQPPLVAGSTRSLSTLNAAGSSAYTLDSLPYLIPNGLTLELVVNPQLFFDNIISGRTYVGGIRIGGSTNRSYIFMGANNFIASGGSGNPPQYIFTLNQDVTYANTTQEIAPIRNGSNVSLGQLVHLLGTIRTSTNTAEFFINGVSVGTAAIPVSWYSLAGADIRSISTGLSTQICGGFDVGTFFTAQQSNDQNGVYLTEITAAEATARYNTLFP